MGEIERVKNNWSRELHFKGFMDYRADLTLEELNKIEPDENEFLIDPFYFPLTASNPKFNVYGKYDFGFEDLRFIDILTPGQKMMSFLGVLDGQILNGGVEQFIFNYPHFIAGVGWSLSNLQASSYLQMFDRAIGSLALKQADFDQIRKEALGGRVPNLDKFGEIYLDLAWTDTEWSNDYLHRLINFVRENPYDFITGVATPTRRS